MESYVRVPIFPLIRYIAAKERGHAPAPMIPVSFEFADRKVQVDEVLGCERSVARKAGGRGFRYLCNVSWSSDNKERTQNSVIWFDDFLQEWFVEVLKSRAPVDWEAATQITELDDFYGA